jgi:cytochrome c oxidase cbb3-type subunit III
LEKLKALRIAVALSGIAAASTLIQFFPASIHAAPNGAQAQQPADDAGAAAYAKRCAMCHGDHREGHPPAIPSLVGIGKQLTEAQITEIVHNGKGGMPAFGDLKDPELAALLHFLVGPAPAPPPPPEEESDAQPSATVEAGAALFHQNCSFCHGRDAMGGETGPDLTQSKLVLGDKTGDAIAAVVRTGRPGNKMPAFNFSTVETADIIAFIRARVAIAAAHPGGRRGVAVADLQTGNAEAGKAYFNGAGGCAQCHSPSGDLAGLASRLEGLKLEEAMLYPRGAKSKVTVTLPSGEKISGTLDYLDEFYVGLRDADGNYHSWPVGRVHYKVDSPADAHARQLPKYTDDDIHNLMAYLQTLR